jgi:hypothetical protein
MILSPLQEYGLNFYWKNLIVIWILSAEASFINEKPPKQKFGGLAIPVRGTHDFASPPRDGFAFFDLLQLYCNKPKRQAPCNLFIRILASLICKFFASKACPTPAV